MVVANRATLSPVSGGLGVFASWLVAAGDVGKLRSRADSKVGRKAVLSVRIQSRGSEGSATGFLMPRRNEQQSERTAVLT